MSLGDLGNVLGVSRRTISKVRERDGYNTRCSDSHRGVLRYRRCRIHRPNPVRDAQSHGSEEKTSCTSRARWTSSNRSVLLDTLHGAPFQALLTFNKHTILTGYGPAQKVVKRAALIGNLSQIAKKHAMCIITDSTKRR